MPPSRRPKASRSRSTSGATEDDTSYSPKKKAPALRNKKKKNKKKQRAESEEEPEVWEVGESFTVHEYIQEMRSVKDEEGKGPWLYEYHIKWLNWEHKDDSWEPRSNFMSDSVIADSFLEHLEQRGIYVPPHARDVPGMSFTPSKEWIARWKKDALEATDMNVREVSPARDILPHHQAVYKATRDARQEAADADYSSQSEEEEEDEDEADLDVVEEDDDDDAASVAMSMSEMSLMDEDLDGYGDDYAYNDADNGFALMFGPSTPRRRRRAGTSTARIPANPSRKRRTGKKVAEVPAAGPEAPQTTTTPRGYLEGQRAKGGSGPSTVRFVSPTRKDGVLRANKRHELELHARGPLDAPPRKIDLSTTPRKTKKNSKTAKATVPLFTPEERADCEVESQRLWREHERAVTLESIDVTSRRVVEDTSNPFIAASAPPSPGNWQWNEHSTPAPIEDAQAPPAQEASAGVVLHPDRLALMQQQDPQDFPATDVDPPFASTWSTTAASSGANATTLVRQRWGSKDHTVRFDDAFEFHPGPVIGDGQAHADCEPEDGELSDTANSAQELSSTLRRLSFGDIIDDNVFDRQRSLQPPSMFHELEPFKKGAINAAISTRPFGELEEGEIEDEPSESDGWEGKGEPVSALVWRSDSEDDANVVDGTLELDEW